MSEKRKKWLKFTIRWGIAALGIWWVVSNINFKDRVLVRNPATGLPEYVQVLGDPPEEAAEFRIAPEWQAPRLVSREALWVRPDRRSVEARLAPGSQPQDLRLLAVKPGRGTFRGREVRQLLVQDPTSDRGIVIAPAQVTRPNDLEVSSPYVEVGLNRMVRQADRKYLLAAIFVLPLSYLLTSLRWHLLLRTQEIHISFRRAFTLNMVGAFYNAFMPGTTGGDIIKAYYAARHTEFRTRAVMTVIIDRAIGLLALIILGGTMAAYQWDVPDCRRVAIISGVLLVMTVLGLVVFYNPLLRKLTGLSFILRRLPMQKQVQKAVHAMEIYGQRPLPVVGAMLLSFPVHSLSIISATFAGLAFSLPLSKFYYWVVVPVVALVGAIPISPQGAGVMEFFAVQLTKGHGATISQAFVLVMSIRVVQMLWNLVAGVFVLMGRYHAPTQKEQESLENDEAAADVRADAAQNGAIESGRIAAGLRGGA